MVQSGTIGTPIVQPAANHAVVNADRKPALALRLPATVNAATVEPMIVVQEQSGIRRLVLDVYQNGHRVDSADLSSIDYQDGLGIVTAKVKVAEGVNEINVCDPRHFGEEGFFTSSSLTCKGDKCVAAEQPVESETTAATSVTKKSVSKKEKDTADAPADAPPVQDDPHSHGSSQNTRAIVGFEQAGGSSAESKTKPVVDFFFMTPFLYDRQEDCDRFQGVKVLECKDRNLDRRVLPRRSFWTIPAPQ